ncbi:MAG: hypothetical protein LBQ84_08295 [Flavobacteriaceae bacterium]|jgi:hypothetical protein|nr:hypothetical protein [Flavobacteriaceae bacterium]
MKKLFLVGALALTGLFATAQESEGLKGTWFVGGQLGFGSTDDGKKYSEKTSSISAVPIVGTFVSPSVAVGLGIGYLGGSSKVGDYDQDKSSKIVIKPLVRKYWNITGGLFFYGQIAAPVIIGTDTKYTYTVDINTGKEVKNENKTNTSDIGLEVSPGFDYVINKWLTIETSFTIFSFNYHSSKEDVKDAKASSEVNVSANPFKSMDDRTVGALQVGVKFLF